MDKEKVRVCNHFWISDSSYCDDFLNCFKNKIYEKSDIEFKIAVARDIRFGKFSAFDYSATLNGKEFGEECVAEIIGLPNEVDLNFINNP